MSASEVFLDTNVLLYLLSSDTAKADRAEALLAAGSVISVQVLNEFASVATRKFGLSIAEVREILATIRAVCTVEPIDFETHDAGLALAEQHRLSIYDALILAAALHARCTVLLTEDMPHGQAIGRLIIRNPSGTS
jgi:predicted nucleic acid-binding protein